MAVHTMITTSKMLQHSVKDFNFHSVCYKSKVQQPLFDEKVTNNEVSRE